VPLPVAGDLHRVDRRHLIAHGHQRADHGPRSVSNPDHDRAWLGILGQVGGEELVQPGDPGDPFEPSRLGQPPACLVNQLDVVMLLGPIIPNDQQLPPPASIDTTCGSTRETSQRTTGQVLSWHVIPSAVPLPTTGTGTV
jgi:hypothetical protein